ncbi:zinc metalloprotease HtpX, partial [Candidatus Parvarchaeota archaeon]|nr:zinc metalloprotease HtpX [Candidatus Parvarchaeota archaeon]
MADFYSQISANKNLSYLLMLVMSALALGAAFALSYIFDLGAFGSILAILIAIAYAYVGYFMSDGIVLSVSGAKPAEKKTYPYLYNTVEGLAIAAGIPMPSLYVIDDPAPNAFATGRDPAHSAIAVTTGLLKLMNRQELEGVIAHEMSHIKNYDIRFATIAVVMVGLIAIIGNIASRSLFYGRGGGSNDNRGSGYLLIIGLVFVILAPIFAQLVQLAISRKREFLADATGAMLTRYPEGLASALEKIDKYHVPMQNASQETAPLYFANPLPGKLMSLFSTHPPV